MTPRVGFSPPGRGALADRAAVTTLAQRAETLGYDSIFVTDRRLSAWARRVLLRLPPLPDEA